jgi:hypothetical protein
MNILERLATTRDPVIREMIEAHQESAFASEEGVPCVADFDNKPTWDNWSKQPDPFKKKTIYFRKK